MYLTTKIAYPDSIVAIAAPSGPILLTRRKFRHILIIAPKSVVRLIALVSFTAVNMPPKYPDNAPNTTAIVRKGTYFHASKNSFAYNNFAINLVITIISEHVTVIKKLYVTYVEEKNPLLSFSS